METNGKVGFVELVHLVSVVCDNDDVRQGSQVVIIWGAQVHYVVLCKVVQA